MFDVDGHCGPVASVGLEGPDDVNAILICRRHLQQLRSLRPREARTLSRYLLAVFRREVV